MGQGRASSDRHTRSCDPRAKTPAQLARELGDGKAGPVTAFLRRQPEVVVAKPAGSLALSRQRLEASLKAYAAGDRGAASDLALSAYLDGFEPDEPVLAARDHDLMAQNELAMGYMRSAKLGRGSCGEQGGQNG